MVSRSLKGIGSGAVLVGLGFAAYSCVSMKRRIEPAYPVDLTGDARPDLLNVCRNYAVGSDSRQLFSVYLWDAADVEQRADGLYASEFRGKEIGGWTAPAPIDA